MLLKLNYYILSEWDDSHKPIWTRWSASVWHYVFVICCIDESDWKCFVKNISVNEKQYCYHSMVCIGSQWTSTWSNAINKQTKVETMTGFNKINIDM